MNESPASQQGFRSLQQSLQFGYPVADGLPVGMECGRVVWWFLFGEGVLVGFYDLVVGGCEFGLEPGDLGGDLFGAVFYDFPPQGYPVGVFVIILHSRLEFSDNRWFRAVVVGFEAVGDNQSQRVGSSSGTQVVVGTPSAQFYFK